MDTHRHPPSFPAKLLFHRTRQRETVWLHVLLYETIWFRVKLHVQAQLLGEMEYFKRNCSE